jgi:hypothetical protein
MRLIDADAMNAELFYKQVGGKDSLITAESAFEMINAQPTAYDVDAVVEQLEDRSTLSRPVGWTKSYEIITLKDAVEIVKGGGVNG